MTQLHFKKEISEKAGNLWVDEWILEDHQIKAVTAGYHVTMRLKDGKITGMHCTCPKAAKQRCEHMAAVVNYYEMDDFYRQLLKEHEENRRDYQFTHAFHNAPEMIAYIDHLKTRSQNYPPPARSFYIFSYILDQDLPHLMARSALQESYQVVLKLIITLRSFQNHTAALRKICHQRAQEIISQADSKTKNSCRQSLEKAMDQGINLDDLRQLSAVYDDPVSRERIARRAGQVIKRLLERDRHQQKGNRTILSWTRFACSLVAEDSNRLLDFMDANSHAYSHYVYIHDYGDRPEASVYLKEALEKDQDYEAFITYYHQISPDFYKRQGMMKEYREELLEQCLRDNAGDYSALKDACNAQEWPYYRRQLIQRLTKSQELELYVQEGMYEQLKDYVLTSGSFLTLEKYRDLLVQYYPEEVLRRYKTDVWKQVEAASTKDDYLSLMEILKGMLAIEGGQAYVQEIIQGWRIAYRRNQELLRILKEFTEANMPKRNRRKK
ncbi:MAG: hypothetical protein ACSW8B_00330 [bacterium]